MACGGPWRCQECRDSDCLHHRSYGPIRVFFQASCGWHAEGLFGQSFSAALPAQALRGAPRVWSYSVVQHVRRLMGQPLHCSADDAGVCGERGYGAGSNPTCDSAVSPCFHGCPASLHRHFPSQSPPSPPPDPSVCPQSTAALALGLLQLPAVAPSRRPAACPGCVRLQQGLPDSHSI